jgi:hypothetical protein
MQLFLYSNLPNKLTQVREIVNQALVNAMHVMRVTVATTLDIISRVLAFSHDMFLNAMMIAGSEVNSMSMSIFTMPKGSNISMTMLQFRKV